MTYDQAVREVYQRQAELRKEAERSRLAADLGRGAREPWQAALAAGLRRIAERLDPVPTRPVSRPAE